MSCKIFISHDHADKEIAEKLVTTIVEYLNIGPGEITCTSVEGFRQPYIASLPGSIKEDLKSCKAFFAILSEKSIGSSWVLSEIGAAWILDKNIVPILCRGLKHGDIPDLVRDPLAIIGDDTNLNSKIVSLLKVLSERIDVSLKSKPNTKKVNSLISKMQLRKDYVHDISLYNRYKIGRFSANVYLGLLGGGDQVFDYKTLEFEYEHKWELLPQPIKEKRDSWISDMEKDAKFKNYEFFNGPAIRLHSFHLKTYQSPTGKEMRNPLLVFRPTCWYDYAVSNKKIDENVLVPDKGLTSIRSEYADFGRLLEERDIDWIKLSNILTVSVVLLTKDKWILIGKRTKRVDNAVQLFAASAAENIHRWLDEPSIPGDKWSNPKWMTEKKSRVPKVKGGKDISVDYDYKPSSCPNPFFTVLRAVKEEIAKEIAHTITIKDITFLSLAWDLKGFNPHLYALVRVNLSIRKVNHYIKGSRGDDIWESTLLPVRFEPGGDLERYLADAKWAEISKGAILRALVHEFGYREVDEAFR